MSVAASRTLDEGRVERIRLSQAAGVTGAVPSAARISAGLAIVRIVAGVVFAAHGAQKIFTFTLPGVSEAFAGMGIPMAGVAGPAVALIEFFGGLALIAGLFTPLVAAALAVVMLGALVLVHLPAGFFLPNGIEFVLVLLATAVALAVTGAGSYSLDAVLAKRRS